MSKDSIFEAHYYSSGIKFLPFGDRPSWVPAADTIIISQDTGISIQEGDYVLGLARFKHNGEPIFWIGLSEKSVDQVYGDRGGNYHGIGIWLRDSLVLNSEDLADIMQKLLAHQSSVQDWKGMGGAVEKAINHIKLGARGDLPAEFKEGKDGLSFGQGSLDKAALWHIQVDNYDLEFHMQVGNLISLFQLINHNFSDFSKLFAVISKNPATAYKAVKFVNTLKPSTYDLNEKKVQMILEVSRKISATEARPSANEASLNKKIEKLQQELNVKNQKDDVGFKEGGSETILATKIEIFKNDLKKINQNTLLIEEDIRILDKRMFVYFLVLFIIFLSILTLNVLTYFNLEDVVQASEVVVEEANVLDGNDEMSPGIPSSPINKVALVSLISGKYHLKCGDGMTVLEIVGDKLFYENAEFSKSRDGQVGTWNLDGKVIKISPLPENKVTFDFQGDKLAFQNRKLETLELCPA